MYLKSDNNKKFTFSFAEYPNAFSEGQGNDIFVLYRYNGLKCYDNVFFWTGILNG